MGICIGDRETEISKMGNRVFRHNNAFLGVQAISGERIGKKATPYLKLALQVILVRFNAPTCPFVRTLPFIYALGVLAHDFFSPSLYLRYCKTSLAYVQGFRLFHSP